MFSLARVKTYNIIGQVDDVLVILCELLSVDTKLFEIEIFELFCKIYFFFMVFDILLVFKSKAISVFAINLKLFQVGHNEFLHYFVGQYSANAIHSSFNP